MKRTKTEKRRQNTELGSDYQLVFDEERRAAS